MVLEALGLSDLTLDRMMDRRGGRVLAFFNLLLTPPFFPLFRFMILLSSYLYISSGKSRVGIGLSEF